VFKVRMGSYPLHRAGIGLTNRLNARAGATGGWSVDVRRANSGSAKAVRHHAYGLQELQLPFTP